MFSKFKAKLLDYLPALRSSNYRLYFLGQGTSLVGTWLQAIAEAWLIYPVLTNHKSLLGVVSAVNLAPTVVLVLLAGVIVDRINKRKALIIQQLIYATITLVMFFLVVSGRVQIWQVIVAAFLMGLTFTFEQPTRQSLMVELVEKKDYPSAISLNAVIFNGARALGPALAGILIATIGIAPVYLVNSLSFLAVILAITLMKFKPKSTIIKRKSIKSEFREGFEYIRNHKAVAVLLVLLFLTTLFSWPTATLLPVYAKDIFTRGEIGFGLLQSAFGVGALIGALIFAKLFSFIKNKYYLLQFMITTAFAGLLMFSLSQNFMLALILQVIIGWAVVGIITSSNTLIQLSIPHSLRGRMMSYYSLVLMGGMPFGALIASLGVILVGARLTSLITAISLFISTQVVVQITKGKFKEKLNRMI